jgi:LuxR family maltose regulon positive regulatory protein
MWVMQHKGAYWVIPELINKVEGIKNNNIELYDSIKHQLVFFKAIINFWTGNIKESIEQFDYVRKEMAFDKMGALSLSSIYSATASQLNGNGKKIYKEIQLEISRNNLPADYKIILLAALVYMKFLEGDLYTAERIAKKIAKLSASVNNDFYTAWYEFFMGYITFQQYRTEEALSYFNKALKLVYLLNTHGPIDAFAGVLLTLKQTNRNKEFEQINNELISFVYEWNNPAYNTVAYSLKTRLSIIDNDLQKASVEFKKTDMSFDIKTIIFNIEVPRITYCRLLLAKDSSLKTNEVIIILTKIYRFATRIHNIPQTIDVLILLSVAYYKNDKLPKAIDNLAEAVAIAVKGHFIYPFVEQSETVEVLLPKVKTDDENIREFISLLSKTISDKNKLISADSLSNRELDIIHLLAQRLSNQEIANKLFISSSTVKRHTINIYQKLGVNKRREAVEKAIETNIIK